MILVLVFCFVSEEDQDQTRHYYTGNIITILNNKYLQFSVSTCFTQLSVLILPQVNYLGLLLKVRSPPFLCPRVQEREVKNMSAMVGPYNAIIDVPGGK